MKYFILVIVSLFCLTSFSDHKKNSMTDEEKVLYNEINERGYTTDQKNREEFLELEKKHFKQLTSVNMHFNKYMKFELISDQADKKNPETFLNLFYLIARQEVKYFTDDEKIREILDCTKELREKKSCQKLPYMSIYWLKKYFMTGFNVPFASRQLTSLLEDYVIPKADMEGSEDFFYLLTYVAWYFRHKANEFEAINIYKETKKESEEDPDLFKKKYPCIQISKDRCADRLRLIQDRKNWYKDYLDKARDRLSKKQKEIADKMVSDLIKKWSKKYGKENIYRKRWANFDPNSLDKMLEFLEKNYPYH